MLGYIAVAVLPQIFQWLEENISNFSSEVVNKERLKICMAGGYFLSPHREKKNGPFWILGCTPVIMLPKVFQEFRKIFLRMLSLQDGSS